MEKQQTLNITYEKDSVGTIHLDVECVELKKGDTVLFNTTPEDLDFTAAFESDSPFDGGDNNFGPGKKKSTACKGVAKNYHYTLSIKENGKLVIVLDPIIIVK